MWKYKLDLTNLCQNFPSKKVVHFNSSSSCCEMLCWTLTSRFDLNYTNTRTHSHTHTHSHRTHSNTHRHKRTLFCAHTHAHFLSVFLLNVSTVSPSFLQPSQAFFLSLSISSNFRIIIFLWFLLYCYFCCSVAFCLCPILQEVLWHFKSFYFDHSFL